MVTIIPMIAWQLTSEEEEASILRCGSVKAEELLLLPDPFYTRWLCMILGATITFTHAVELHGFEDPASPVKELGHLLLPLLPPISLEHHFLEVVMDTGDVSQHVPRL